MPSLRPTTQKNLLQEDNSVWGGGKSVALGAWCAGVGGR
jgi:hypothetical protein